VAADETTRTTNQCSFHFAIFRFVSDFYFLQSKENAGPDKRTNRCLTPPALPTSPKAQQQKQNMIKRIQAA